VQTGLDFVNTLDLWPVTHDHLDAPIAALDWLVAHDLMHLESRTRLLAQYAGSPAIGAEMLNRLRRVRRAMPGVIEASAAHRAPAGASGAACAAAGIGPKWRAIGPDSRP